ncbi:Homeodomain-like superfamily protein [Arabidopsis thaliana]|uniref:Homeodomain-like superfamily protein n=1 Tax=Arabidopsis thaliana TaxID=3702 RepID=F4I129_ARATH|nr:Homeodomain-like superfamily protein [Arabidopsis thaliana]AEE28483.1 Homeodomain-like superfamily protein [Arabidopsis thaliana]|eukprot:NP_001184950.1 Homeodomain-like superfamily protein [Arabidopsis thaliana]
MVANNNTSSNRRKRIITEGDIATLLLRYDMETILRMLQEISYCSETKMDWNALVKKTTTGITNAREYQLLWRHLSYRHPLLPVEDDALPLDDDSDMECELEASPAVSHEASVEAIAHVKVMAASYVLSESDILDDSTVEAPLTINIPYALPEGSQEPSESPWSSRGMNINFPVCLQKVTSTEGMNGNGSAGISMAFRRKRKRWSAEEDEELFAAVKRCGEGNWAHIVKGDFRGERTASQLSQRWALIRKRCHTSTSVSQCGLQGTEAKLAVNHALSLALGNRPPSNKLAIGTSSRRSFPANSSIYVITEDALVWLPLACLNQKLAYLFNCGLMPTTSSCTITETEANGGSSSQGQQQSKPIVQALPRAGTSLPAAKSRVVKKTTASSTSRSDLMVTANSVAAAACMGDVLTAASGRKVEPGKTDAPRVPKTKPVKHASTVCMPQPSGSLSMPKVEPGTSVAASIRSLANGKLKPVMASSSSNKPPLIAPRSEGSSMLSASAPLASLSRIVSNQRVFAGSVPATEIVTCKPDGGQKGQARGNEASSSAAIQPHQITSRNLEISQGKQATQAQSPNLLPRKVPVVRTAVHCATNQKLMDKPSDQTVVPIRGAGSQSKAKGEVNSKVGPVIKVSSVCGKPLEVATVAGTGQGV